MRNKVASSYMYTNDIYCVLLPTNTVTAPHKEKIISVLYITNDVF